MTNTLFVQDLIHSNEDSCFLHVTKAIVNGRAKHFHGGRKTHIGIHEWRYIETTFADFAVEDAVVCLEVLLAEELREFCAVGLNFQWLHGDNQFLRVTEMLL